VFAAHRLFSIASDPFLDLVAAEERRMEQEGSNDASAGATPCGIAEADRNAVQRGSRQCWFQENASRVSQFTRLLGDLGDDE